MGPFDQLFTACIILHRNKGVKIQPTTITSTPEYDAPNTTFGSWVKVMGMEPTYDATFIIDEDDWQIEVNLRFTKNDFDPAIETPLDAELKKAKVEDIVIARFIYLLWWVYRGIKKHDYNRPVLQSNEQEYYCRRHLISFQTYARMNCTL